MTPSFGAKLLATCMVFHTMRVMDAQSTCLNNLEFTIYNDNKTFSAAAQTCRSVEGSLAKVYNSNVKEKIAGVLRGRKYYVGLKRKSSNWFWQDGSEQNSYQNWKANKPSDQPGKDCVVSDGADEGKWENVICGETFPYICQKDIKLSFVTQPLSSFNVSASGESEIRCAASVVTDCPGDTIVTWYRPQSAPKQISISRLENDIYQLGSTIGSTTASLLALTNANISDAGRYVCKATFSAQDENEMLMKEAEVFVSVPGAPDIVEIYREKCTSHLTVSWRPSKTAIDFSHKITIYPTYGQSNSERLTVHDKTSRTRNNTFFSLAQSTEYTVKITACKTEKCIDYDEHSTKKVAVTGGIPRQIKSAEILPYSGACNLTWRKPTIIGDEIIGYDITVKETGLKTGNSSESEYSVKFRNLASQSFAVDIEPDRDYKFQIRAVTCAGKGEPVTANGSCTGDASGILNFDFKTFGMSMGVPAVLIIAFIVWKVCKTRKSANITKVPRPTARSMTIDHGYENIEPNTSTETATEPQQNDVVEVPGNFEHPYHEISTDELRSASTLESTV